MTNDDLRQFAILQMEVMLEHLCFTKEEQTRLWAALYCVQAMDGGPTPADFSEVIHEAFELDEVE